MNGKARLKENKPLPSRWRWRSGAIYYRVPPAVRDLWEGKSEYLLGRSLPEAHETFARKVGFQGRVVDMASLCDRYALEVVPTKSPATRRSNQYSLARIRAAFGTNRVAAIRPRHVYAYRDHIGKTESRKKANLDLEVLSHMFTKSIEWGLRDDHPMTDKKVTKFSLAPRRVAVDDGDLVRFADGLPRWLQLYISLKLWTGRRKGELLRLTRSDLLEQGLRFTNNKNPGDVFILPWEDATRAVVAELLSLPGPISPYLFRNRKGGPYIDADGQASSFDSVWQRAMAKAVKSGVVRQRFTEHDLRKVRASDLPLEQAQALLRHTTPKMTKTYRVKPDVVQFKG